MSIGPIIRKIQVIGIEEGIVTYKVSYPQENRETIAKTQLPLKELLEEVSEGKWRIQYTYASVMDRALHAPTSYEKYRFNPKTNKYDILDFHAVRVEVNQGGFIFKVSETGEMQFRESTEFVF